MYSSLSPKDGKNSTIMKKDSGKEENAVQYSDTLQSKEERLSRNRSLILRKTRASASCRENFPQDIEVLHNSIPKHITTLDEKYVLRCLELIRTYSIQSAALDFASKVDVLPIDFSSLAIECPLSIGTISGSQSMINILNSPLLQKYSSIQSDDNFGRQFVEEPLHSDFIECGEELSELKKEEAIVAHRHTSTPVHKRVVSMSNTYSSLTGVSSSDYQPLVERQSASRSVVSSFQGMLQCTWNDGLPHHVFTVDEKKEVYVANFSKDLDYAYSFHLKKRGKKEYDTNRTESESVGKMRVSTSITLCSDNNMEVRETQFVLSLSDENSLVDSSMSTNSLRKNKRLTKKVVDVFRSNHPYKKRSSSKFGGSNAILEDSLWDPSEEVHLDPSDVENGYIQNLEMAAIVVKEVYENRKEDKVGGWGLKFLKKPENNVASKNLEASTRNSGECSTSLNVLIPAGLHGGPRTRVGGPSSLTERWMSGGHCDCGGWDIGCPLTVLNARSSKTGSLTASSAEWKSIELFTQGAKQEVPYLKMVNIHGGLYYINFQSTLSTLQSFAIATAIIHSHNHPVLRSKLN